MAITYWPYKKYLDFRVSIDHGLQYIRQTSL